MFARIANMFIKLSLILFISFVLITCMPINIQPIVVQPISPIIGNNLFDDDYYTFFSQFSYTITGSNITWRYQNKIIMTVTDFDKMKKEDQKELMNIYTSMLQQCSQFAVDGIQFTETIKEGWPKHVFDQWAEENKHLTGTYQYDRVVKIINAALTLGQTNPLLYGEYVLFDCIDDMHRETKS